MQGRTKGMHSSTADAESMTTKDVNRQGGLRARLGLIGGFFAFFCSVGFLNAFGVFEEYYKEHELRNKSESQIAWIGSFQIFMMFACAPPAGLLVDKVGPTVLLSAGSLGALIAIFMTSLCHAYYQFFLAQGLLLGASMSFVFCPAIATVSRYFPENRALAIGFTIAGSSTGGIIWPVMLNKLLTNTTLGFGWTMRIVGFTMIPLLVLVCLIIRHPVKTLEKPSSPFHSIDSPAETESKTEPDVPLLKNRALILLCIGLGVSYLGFFSPFFYVSTYASSIGLSTSLSFYLVSIINGASFIGRVLPGVLADRYGPFNLMTIAVTLSSVVAFTWTTATNTAGLIVWVLAYGFVSGAILSLQGACATSITKPEEHGKVIGLVMGSVAITGLIGGPIAGALLNHYGFLALATFSGAFLLAGSIFMAFACFTLDKRVLAFR